MRTAQAWTRRSSETSCLQNYYIVRLPCGRVR